MNLSLAARSQLYDQLGKLLVAGFPFLRAVETLLSARPHGGTRRILEKFQARALQGATITESFSDPALPFSPMEISLLSACERSGQLQRGCEFLTRYYLRLDTVRSQIIHRTIYPFLMLHAGVVLLAIPDFFTGNSPALVLRKIAMQLGSFYLLALVVYVFSRLLIRVAVHSRLFDGLLGMLPIFGKIRRALALSRFCTTYQMQLDAGVNVMDSLDSAARASASARLLHAVRAILPEIRAGHAVGPELAKTGAFPSELGRSLVVGEQTGTLDAELLAAAADQEGKALRGIETFGEWMPRLIYFVIVLFLAWNIISAAKTSTQQLNQLIDSSS